MKENFIGRNAELETLFNTLKIADKAIVSIFGEGGVGKSCLAEKFLAESSKIKNINRIFIDFDLLTNRDINLIRKIIIDSINSPDAAKYFESIKELRRLQKLNLTGESIYSDIKEKSKQIFERIVAENKTKTVLVFDTFERIQGGYLQEDLLEIIKIIPRAFIIILGRENHKIRRQLTQLTPSRGSLIEIKLIPLTVNETKTYLRRNLGRKVLSNNRSYMQNLFLLTKGKPILLDLAITWILRNTDTNGKVINAKNWPGKKLLEVSLAKIKESLKRYQDKFEDEVVSGIRDLVHPLNWAILYMSLIDFPCTERMWEELLDLSLADAVKLKGTLQGLFFVRADFTLHDEMRMLIGTHIWPYLTQSKKIQMLKRLLSFNNKDRTKNQFEWALKRLSLLVELNPEKSEALFRDTWEQAFNQDKQLCYRLIDWARRRIVWERLGQAFRDLVDSCDLQVKGQDNSLESNRELLEKVHKIVLKESSSKLNRVEALASLAYSFRNTNPQESLSRYKQAYELAKEAKFFTESARILRFMGTIYRRLARYPEAINTYEHSLKLAREHGDVNDVAATQNDLAYIYIQIGDTTNSLNLARMALKIRKDQKDDTGLGYSYLTIGQIYSEENYLEEAEKAFVDAKNIFTQKAMKRNIAQANVYLGHIYRKLHQPNIVDKLLTESIEIFESLNDKEGLADAYNEFGCELRKRGREVSRSGRNYKGAEKTLAKAEEYFKNSISFSLELGNYHKLVDSFADMALVYRYWYENAIYQRRPRHLANQYIVKAQTVAREAIKVCRENSFALEESRALEALGDIYYSQGLLFKAFAQYYLPACFLLADFYGKRIARYNQVFDRVHKKIFSSNASPLEVRLTAEYMARRWIEERKNITAPEFAVVYSKIAESYASPTTGEKP